MDKTLHKKHTEKHLYNYQPSHCELMGDDGQPNLLAMLREDAKNLMQPRQEAITNLLKLARSM